MIFVTRELAVHVAAPDILVQTACICPGQPFDAMPVTAWRPTFAVNVESMFLTCQVASHEAARLAPVMNLTSGVVGPVLPCFTHGIADKTAVLGLAWGLATEPAEPGQASTVAGGGADLPRWRSGS